MNRGKSARPIGLVLGPILFIALLILPPLGSPVTGEPVNPEAPWAPNAALGLLLWVLT
ncbi:MAG: hypothetical protein ABWW65_01685 [Thermoprotei archaeon]